jgi:hypothetical protein
MANNDKLIETKKIKKAKRCCLSCKFSYFEQGRLYIDCICEKHVRESKHVWDCLDIICDKYFYVTKDMVVMGKEVYNFGVSRGEI